jgi:hypothetical protein
MKKILVSVVLCLLATTPSWAQKVNVISQYPESEISIDGKYVANKAVYDYQVDAGNHVIEVKKNGQVFLRKSVMVGKDMVETVYAEDFVNLPQSANRVANRGAKDLEASRVRDSRGSIAIGLHFSSGASGLSGKYFFTNKLAAQLVGWESSSDKEKYGSFGYRLIYNLVDTLDKENLSSLYIAIGAGNTSASSKVESFVSYQKDMQEIVIGIEFPGSFQNMTYHIEAGEEILKNFGVQESSGFKFNAGTHFYF